MTSFSRQKCKNLAPVPGKPISTNRGLNLANPALKFIQVTRCKDHLDKQVTPVYLAFTAPDEGEFCLTEILGNKTITLLSCPISLAVGFLKFIRWLHSVPESTINNNQGINEGLN